MAGRIRSSDIDEVKARVNIADVVGEYVQLKPASVGSLKGLCPFHSEKSPSFNVRPVQGFYHCFGCGEGGDVFKFLQQLESLSFTEAVERCAAKIGYQLTYEAGGDDRVEHQQRTRVFEANAAAAAYYQQQLLGDEAKLARDFLNRRGFDKDATDHFGVGYAPKAWSLLSEHLSAKGFSPEELVSAGLANKGDRGLYDKFRGRVIWPIRDTSSQIIGFGARKLYDEDTGPKYLNTSETPVYHKSQVLYGLDLAKKDIVKRQEVVVVEGYTDVMACHLAGITTAVATCGTAFGDDHIRVINRLLGNTDAPASVIFTFDPDAAGQKAAMRAFADSGKFSAQTFVAVGPDGLDPSDLRQQRGDAAVLAMIAAKKPLFEFAIRTQIAKFDLNTLEGRVAAARAAAPIIADIRDAALKPAYIRELAGWVNLDGNEVSRLVETATKAARGAAVKDLRRGDLSNEAAPAPSEAALDANDPIVRFERQVLEVLLQAPQSAPRQVVEDILNGGFSVALHNAIARGILAKLDQVAEASWLNAIEGTLDEGSAGQVRALAAAQLPATDQVGLQRYAKGVLAKALDNLLSRQKNELLAQLRREADNPQSSALVQQQLVELEAQRRKLRESGI